MLVRVITALNNDNKDYKLINLNFVKEIARCSEGSVITFQDLKAIIVCNTMEYFEEQQLIANAPIDAQSFSAPEVLLEEAPKTKKKAPDPDFAEKMRAAKEAKKLAPQTENVE